MCAVLNKATRQFSLFKGLLFLFTWAFIFLYWSQILISPLHVLSHMGIISDGYDTGVNLAIIAIKKYSDAKEDKQKILIENGKECGVYQLTNKLNGKRYIGSGVNLAKRLANYYSKSHIETTLLRSKMPVYLAVVKYGINNFKIEILEYCDKSVVLERETYYIGKLNPEYNILKVGGSCLGFKFTGESLEKLKIHLAKVHASRKGCKHSEETKIRMRLSAAKREEVTAEVRAKISSSLLGRKGRKHSEETLAKMRESHSKRIKNPVSEESKAKMLAALINRECSIETRAKMSKANGMKVTVINMETGESVEYVSVREASRKLDSNNTTISSYIKNNKLFRGIYRIEKI